MLRICCCGTEQRSQHMVQRISLKAHPLTTELPMVAAMVLPFAGRDQHFSSAWPSQPQWRQVSYEVSMLLSPSAHLKYSREMACWRLLGGGGVGWLFDCCFCI